jgi:hypothetical protein
MKLIVVAAVLAVASAQTTPGGIADEPPDKAASEGFLRDAPKDVLKMANAKTGMNYQGKHGMLDKEGFRGEIRYCPKRLGWFKNLVHILTVSQCSILQNLLP